MKKTVRHDNNPFLENMTIPTKTANIKVSRLGRDNNVLINQNTGEDLGTHVTTYKVVDSQRFVKLFTQNIALTFNLDQAGIKAFSILAWAVQHKALSRDRVQLDGVTLIDFLKSQENQNLRYSLSVFRKGLITLERSQIIAKTLRKGEYYINPNFVFNGDRIAFTNVIEREKTPNP